MPPLARNVSSQRRAHSPAVTCCHFQAKHWLLKPGDNATKVVLGELEEEKEEEEEEERDGGDGDDEEEPKVACCEVPRWGFVHEDPVG